MISNLMYKRNKNHFDEISKFNYLDGREVHNDNTIEIDSFKKEKIEKANSFKTDVSNLLVKTRLTYFNYLYLSKIKKYNLKEFEDKIKNADVLIIGGGNMIFDMYERTLGAARFNEYVDIAKKYNKKVFAMSLGIGPFQTEYQAKKAVKVLSRCDFVTFRDEKSFEIYNNRKSSETKNAFVAVDPVFSLPPLIEKKDEGENVGINIINNPVYSNDHETYTKVVDGYVLLIEKLTVEMNKNIKLFSTETRDYEVINDVFSRIKNKEKVEVVHIKNIDELLNLYSEISLLIGARMHSMIIAYTQMIPIIGLSWQPKVRAMFDIINDKESCYDLTKIPENIESILALSQEKITVKQTEEIENQLKVIKEKERINDKILNELSNDASI